MGAKEEYFKEELAGGIQKKIFKAELKGDPMLLSPEMKLIVPLVKFTSVSGFADKLYEFDKMEWSHNRMRNGALCYNGYPVLEKITEQSFYLWDGWKIYHRHKHFMKSVGWVESDENHSIENVYCYFRPLGFYGDDDYIEITRQDKSVEKFPLPEYNANGKHDNGFIVNTTRAKLIKYCYMSSEGLVEVNVPAIVGVTVDKLGLQGHCVSFPCQQG